MSVEIANWLLEACVAVSLATGVAMLLRQPLRRHFGAGAAYAAWLGVPGVLVAVSLPVTAGTVGAMVAPMVAPIAGVFPAPESAAAPTRTFALQAWAAGALAFVLWQAWRQRVFLRHLGPLRQRPDGNVQSVCTRGLPAVVGLRPRIVLPGDFEVRYSPEERALVLEHERVHQQRGDVLANATMAALRALFWFNPLLHWAGACFRRDQELSCDAIVMRRHPGARRAYGDAMLKTELAGQPLPIGCQWHGSHPLKERIAMLKIPPTSPGRRVAGRVLVLSLVLGLSTLAWAGQSSEAKRSNGLAESGISGEVPKYPDASAKAGEGGKVVLKVLVGTDGRAKDIEFAPEESTVAADSALVASARDAAATWTFNPQRKDGQAVEAWVMVPVTFEPPAKPSPEA